MEECGTIFRPGYREFSAPAALRGTVACLWVRVSETAQQVRVVPDGCTDVVWRHGEGTTFVGPDTAAKLVDCAPGDITVGIRFLPGAGGEALDVDAGAAPTEVLARLAAAATGRQADPLVVVAARRIGQGRTSALARELGISERQLRRRFHAAVGYGPKTLARVLRFRRFVDAVAPTSHTSRSIRATPTRRT
jgi:AraC-like DNA-binding protein